MFGSLKRLASIIGTVVILLSNTFRSVTINTCYIQMELEAPFDTFVMVAEELHFGRAAEVT